EFPVEYRVAFRFPGQFAGKGNNGCSTVIPVYLYFFILESLVSVKFSESEEILSILAYPGLQAGEICHVIPGHIGGENIFFIRFPFVDSFDSLIGDRAGSKRIQ